MCKFGLMNQNCQFVLKFGAYSHSRGIGGLTLVFVWGGTLPGGSISVFRGFYASVGGGLVSGGAGRWAVILWGLDTFLRL